MVAWRAVVNGSPASAILKSKWQNKLPARHPVSLADRKCNLPPACTTNHQNYPTNQVEVFSATSGHIGCAGCEAGQRGPDWKLTGVESGSLG